MNRDKASSGYPFEKGAVTVESALTLLLFLILVFGIIEFALLIFKASSLVQATRAGARYLIVNNPAVDLSDIDCDDPDSASSEGTCDSLNCGDLVTQMQKFYEPLDTSQVYVRYSCSNTGYSDSYFHIYEVQVSVIGAKYHFMTPGILGFDAPVTLPEFTTTRTSEDLETDPP